MSSAGGRECGKVRLGGVIWVATRSQIALESQSIRGALVMYIRCGHGDPCSESLGELQIKGKILQNGHVYVDPEGVST